MGVDIEWDEPEIEYSCDIPDCKCDSHTIGCTDGTFRVLCKDHFKELMDAVVQLKRFQSKFGIQKIPAYDETQKESLFEVS